MNYFTLLAYKLDGYVCNEHEKQLLWGTIQKMMNIVINVRQEGILCLEDILETEEDVFLCSCIRYVILEYPTQNELREYTSKWILASQKGKCRLIEMAIIADGMEMLLLNKCPSTAWYSLGAWLGTDYAPKIEEKILKAQQAVAMQVKETERLVSIFPEFDELCDIPKEKLTAVISKSDKVQLALALKGASKKTFEHIKRTALPNEWEKVENGMQVTKYPRAVDVYIAQKLTVENI